MREKQKECSESINASILCTYELHQTTRMNYRSLLILSNWMVYYFVFVLFPFSFSNIETFIELLVDMHNTVRVPVWVVQQIKQCENYRAKVRGLDSFMTKKKFTPPGRLFLRPIRATLRSIYAEFMVYSKFSYCVGCKFCAFVVYFIFHELYYYFYIVYLKLNICTEFGIRDAEIVAFFLEWLLIK